jgi:hypothetical protein
MKKLFVSTVFAILSLVFLPEQTISAKPKDFPTSKEIIASKTAAKPEENAEVKAMIDRLNEIKAMDKSKLSSAEKKDLRKEVKSIRSNLKDVSGGIYISGAAVIVIVVLLLILL